MDYMNNWHRKTWGLTVLIHLCFSKQQHRGEHIYMLYSSLLSCRSPPFTSLMFYGSKHSGESMWTLHSQATLKSLEDSDWFDLSQVSNPGPIKSSHSHIVMCFFLLHTLCDWVQGISRGSRKRHKGTGKIKQLVSSEPWKLVVGKLSLDITLGE